MSTYLQRVIAGQVPADNQIIANMQTIFNLLPNLNIDVLVSAMLTQSNDVYLAVYVASMVRSVLALHGLLTNKIKYRNIDEFLETGTLPPAQTAVVNTITVSDSKNKS